MTKQIIQVEVDTDEDLSKYEKLEYKIPKNGEIILNSYMKATNHDYNSSAAWLVLIPKKLRLSNLRAGQKFRFADSKEPSFYVFVEPGNISKYNYCYSFEYTYCLYGRNENSEVELV